jgi:hypothetical protein
MGPAGARQRLLAIRALSLARPLQSIDEGRQS